MNREEKLFSFDELRNLTIGTVESVSPAKIEVALETNAPQNTAINTGIPLQFPRINGYVLIPNESGALIGQITWLGVHYSNYPKRKGFKDFDLVDLPYPLRKMTISPLGVLKKTREEKYEIERGVYSYPSVGDAVILPTQIQLKAIAENNEEGAEVQIGTCPLAGNAPVRINPNKFFGRHVAVLGNTGSGKSCSVAGIIRWSLQEAEKVKKDDYLNARFIILDPNGEYKNSFNGLGEEKRIFQVVMDGNTSKEIKQLQVPGWLWNSYEWSSLSQATSKTQRPLLRRALKELRNTDDAGVYSDDYNKVYSFFSSLRVTLKDKHRRGPAAIAEFPGKQNTGEFLKSCYDKALKIVSEVEDGELKTKVKDIVLIIKSALDVSVPNDRGFYPAFSIVKVEEIIEVIEKLKDIFGSIDAYDGPDEDTPIYFKIEDLPSHLSNIADDESTSAQFIDSYIMRLRSIIADIRIRSVIHSDKNLTLTEWLSQYVGNNKEKRYFSIIDLSLVPNEIIHLTIAIISRIIFEAIQRFKKVHQQELPTVLVLEEAHTFIKKYSENSEEISSARLCCQTFERIAREGRKFGLGLMLSSQRPSELSPTVLSQCNTFLLHRIVNDEDQRLVRKLVPDNMGGLLDELPVLPSRKAILTGWAAPIPVLVEMNYLAKEHQPDSQDPDYWKVWTGEKKVEVKWDEVVKDWQGNPKTNDEKKDGTDE